MLNTLGTSQINIKYNKIRRTSFTEGLFLLDVLRNRSNTEKTIIAIRNKIFKTKWYISG